MSPEPGLTHRFPMLRRAIEHQVNNGRFAESLKLVEELFRLAPEDTGLSRLKARIAADLIRRAAQAQRREVGAEIARLFDDLVPSGHLTGQERDLVSKAKEGLLAL